MSRLPTVAIIGRPNTGKSTLFNRLVGRRNAIVSDIPGTTRDQIASRVETEEMDFLLVDTGGMGGGTEDTELEDDVHAQSALALAQADIIVLTLNNREELTASDHEIVSILRRTKRKHVPVIIAVTKCDNPAETDETVPQYFALGLTEDIIPVSAPHKIGVDDLVATIIKRLQELHFEAKNESETASAPQNQPPRIAIIGKPNVGKSSIVNALMSETQRAKSPLLVSSVAGTTRDTTDTVIMYHEKEYMFMDTAGIKRRKQTEEDIETHAYFRSIRALEMCDIAIVVLDATEPPSKQDKRIAALAIEAGKGLIILMNKSDLLSAEQKVKAMSGLHETLRFCRYASVIPCSATSREGLLKLFDAIESVQENRIRRIATKELHRWFQEAVIGQPMGELTRSKHITQAEEIPPTFVLFVRDPKKVQVSQLRYLDNRLREHFDFAGTPVRWVTKVG